MAAYVELVVDQGTTFNNVINITDDVTNAAVNIANYSFESQVRRSYYSANITANIICTVTNASNGEVTMSISASNTANIKPGRYVFDVKSTNGDNIVDRILEGIITINPSVTK
jgi:hypothetical protein